MTLRQQVFAVVASVALLIFIVEMVRRRRLREESSWLWIVTGVVKAHLQGCDALILEANHDPQMLIDGPYPWPLKQRIRGRSGHLSNEDAAMFLETLVHERLSHVVLAHLSEENNTPEKAKRTVQTVINPGHTTIHVASQVSGTRVLRLGE